MTTIRQPPPIRPGDTIGIIAPAGQLQEPRLFARGVSILQEMGFAVRFPRELWSGCSYLADSDENRSREFNQLVSDPEVKVLLALRGGYGCLRMLGGIDIALFARQPKMVVGFSDITVLQNYLYGQTGVISLHGPVLTSLAGATQVALERFYRALTGGWWERIASSKIEILQDAPNVHAPLVGGNLASLLTLLGTPYECSWRGKIVFLEDTNEAPYRLDRMLTQLWLAGKFDGIRGLILGDFSSGTGTANTDDQRCRETVWQRILEIAGDRSMPIWGNFPSGHCPGNLTLPLGAVAEMAQGTPSLSFALAKGETGGNDV
ncbi:MAG: LD-carboxypeptidase [Desulforhopalus sp.]|nr:LD-carboxypeptidase [Desulforhopalus sp.]